MAHFFQMKCRKIFVVRFKYFLSLTIGKDVYLLPFNRSIRNALSNATNINGL